ncbi:MAG: dTDP-glucose 4,6-dehydratase [Verrucomicrobia bacterium ADurb.Bin474]|nr:MAG: dTDP-glucose 4,6-dehydratase [Verrucomicrobia bacterium ADurb.Bin474]
MKLLVTGGAGFIGSNFVRHLLRSQPAGTITRLVNLDKLTYAGNPESLRDLENDPRYVFVKGDIGDTGICTRLFEEHAFDAVINFAAESHVDRSIDSPEPFFETNVVGTLRLLNTTLKYWRSLDEGSRNAFRFLHVSTDEVYGSLSPQDPAFSETTPFAPNSPYSASKAASDHIVRAYHHTYGLPVVTTNCSNNYGPYQFPEKLIPLMILNALEGKSLPIYGDGMNIRDWLYVDDHCSGIWTALSKGKPGETYNIGGKNEQPNIAIVDTICDLLDKKQPRSDGKSYKSQKIYVKDRPGHDRRYAIDCSKIETQLGWAPAETFETGIEKTIDWYLANREWCQSITEGKYRRERLGNA